MTNTPSSPTQEVERAIRYRPSSGTEGMDFSARWCSLCRLDAGLDCEIQAMTFALDVDHPDYPPEWVFERGEPVCTAFDALDPLDQPLMKTAAVADLFPGAPARPTTGEQVRMLVRALHLGGENNGR